MSWRGSYFSPFFMYMGIAVYLLVPQWTLGYPPLALATRAPVNMGLPASEPLFCLEYKSRSGITGSCGNSVFNFLSN